MCRYSTPEIQGRGVITKPGPREAISWLAGEDPRVPTISLQEIKGEGDMTRRTGPR